MLTDIGITRADLRDAFSAPFWEDPTVLLNERALERRLSRALAYASAPAPVTAETAFPPSAHRSVAASGGPTTNSTNTADPSLSSARSATCHYPLLRPDHSARRPLRRAHRYLQTAMAIVACPIAGWCGNMPPGDKTGQPGTHAIYSRRRYLLRVVGTEPFEQRSPCIPPISKAASWIDDGPNQAMGPNHTII